MAHKLDVGSKGATQFLPLSVPEHLRLEMPPNRLYPRTELVILWRIVPEGRCTRPNRETIKLWARGDDDTRY